MIWGSTYLLVAFAVEEIPPFKMVSVRFLLAAAILFVIAYLSKAERKITKQQLKNSAIAGFLFLACGNGGVSWALQYVDTGLTALLIAAQPLVLVLMMWVVNKKPLPFYTFLGVFLGIIGMSLLVAQDGITHSSNQIWGLIVIFCCLVSWGAGSIFVGKADLPKSFMYNTAIQMLVGGLCLSIFSVIQQESATDWFSLSHKTIWSLAGLVLLGSVVAFTAFNFLLAHVSPEKVSTSTYVNPIIALFLGWMFRDEIINHQSMVAAIVLLTGVYFMTTKKSGLPNRFRKIFTRRV